MAETSISATGLSIKKALSELYNKLFGQQGARDDMQRINALFIPFVGAAILAAARLGWTADATGPVLLWVFASLAAGGTAGFLFGIPKSGLLSKVERPAPAGSGTPALAVASVAVTSDDEVTQRARPNTNLEEVSDWLTKILVGLTLANLKDLKSEVERISLNAAAAIRPNPSDAEISAATALVVGFALVGFVAGYLYMRLFVQGAIARSDNDLHQFRSALTHAQRIGQQEELEPAAHPDIAAAVVPSAASLTAAQEVANAAPPNNPELVLRPLRELASEYEALRQTKEYSPTRTQQMGDIVRRMRPYAIAAAAYINDLIQSTSTGDHLAATVILQMKYMPEHMQWLARRLVEERAFIGYQAASALLARVRVAGVPECRDIQTAVAQAKEERTRRNIAEGSLDKLIDRILEAR